MQPMARPRHAAKSGSFAWWQPQRVSKNFESRQVIASRRWLTIGQDSTASASMTSGGRASSGEMAMRTMSRLWTTTGGEDTIRAEDVAQLDFSDVAGTEHIGPVTPGEVLREEFMVPIGLSHARWPARWACRQTGLPQSRRAVGALPPRPRSCWASDSARRPSSGSISRWRTIWRKRGGTCAGQRDE
jgi:hypothetical protein